MFTATILALVSGGLDGAAIDPCSSITAPPIVIHEIHAATIEIAVAWHAPAEGDLPCSHLWRPLAISVTDKGGSVRGIFNPVTPSRVGH